MADAINTTITGLWVPVVVFSHLFAFFWLFRMWMLHHPNLFSRKKGKGPSSSGSASDGDGVELEIRTEDMVATLAKQPPPSSGKKDAKRKSDQVHGKQPACPRTQQAPMILPAHPPPPLSLATCRCGGGRHPPQRGQQRRLPRAHARGARPPGLAAPGVQLQDCGRRQGGAP
jgi:hypothetical protein